MPGSPVGWGKGGGLGRGGRTTPRCSPSAFGITEDVEDMAVGLHARGTGDGGREALGLGRKSCYPPVPPP